MEPVGETTPQGQDQKPRDIRISNGSAHEQSTLISPPYWQYQRSISNASVDSTFRPPPISLEDHTEAHHATSGALWAKDITIEDYVIVRGGTTGIGAYVVWNCKVQTLDGGPMIIRKRYSEFSVLREQLLAAFPVRKPALPQLPPKSMIYKFRPDFLERRRMGLSYFLNCVMLNPEFSGSPILKDFIFSHPS